VLGLSLRVLSKSCLEYKVDVNDDGNMARYNRFYSVEIRLLTPSSSDQHHFKGILVATNFLGDNGIVSRLSYPGDVSLLCLVINFILLLFV
jgi:hypothetical protein